MNDPTPFLRLYVLPVWLAAMVVGALLFEMWAVAAITSIFTLSVVYAQKDEYPRGVKQSARTVAVRGSWTDAGRLGVSVVAAGAAIVVGVLSFGFSIGVIAAMAMWAIIFALWVRALLRRSRAG